MSDGEGILSAIIDNPADDGSRLVYADWLDDNGQHDRAEFVRAQIRLAREGRKLRREDRDALRGRIGVILSANYAEWVRAPYPFVNKCGVKRGFLSWASVPMPGVQPPTPEAIRKLLSNEPLEKLVLRAGDAAGTRRLFGWLGCQPPASLHTVWITLPGLRLGDADLLFTSPLTAGRREVRLNHCAMSAPTLQRLQLQARLRGLEIRLERGYEIVKPAVAG